MHTIHAPCTSEMVIGESFKKYSDNAMVQEISFQKELLQKKTDKEEDKDKDKDKNQNKE